MKAKYHFPTEQYGFVEVEEEVKTIEDAIENYKASQSLYKPLGEGLEVKEFNRAVCEYLNTGELVDGAELYRKMSAPQQDWFQITKRAFKRIKYETGN